MSHRPNLTAADFPYKPDGPNGERYCRYCGRQLTGRRQSWCGNICVHEYRIRREPAYARARVEERDRGICALCGVDTRRIERVMERLRNRCQGMETGVWVTRAETLPITPLVVDRASRVIGALRGRGFDVSMKRYATGYVVIEWRALWEADHVIPLAEGGIEAVRRDGLAAYRTLCRPDHKRVTVDLNARLREQRDALSGRSATPLLDVLRRQAMP